MQRRFDLHAAANETRRKTAGQIVPLEHEHVQSLIGKHQRRGETGKRAADHDHIIMILIKLHTRFPPSHKTRERVSAPSFGDDQKNRSTSSREYSAVSSISPKLMTSPA